MTKITIVFCEGQHDIAFLSKILFMNNFKKYDKKIKNFISPLDKQFENVLLEKKISDRRLGFQSEYIVPSVALQKSDDELIFLHNLNGDGRGTERKEILEMYQNLINGDDDFSPKNDLAFKFLYFFDADDKTITERVDGLNDELKLDDKLEHNVVKTIGTDQWGCYIFHSSNNGGVLEDILLDLMKPNNEKIFTNAEKFITDTSIDKMRQTEYICHEDRYRTKVKFKEKKSIISIAGQLQFSSMSSAVIIANSDYIKKEDIERNTHCNDIIKLFNV